MRPDHDLSQLHPVAVFAALAAGGADASPSPVDAEPDSAPERVQVRRRLLAVLARRLGSDTARARASAPTA
jgi:hypothetical protein